MPRWSRAAVLVATVGLWVGGCQREDKAGTGTAGPPAVTLDAYGRDVDRICHSLQYSGAEERPEGERAIAVAQWLGVNIETDEGRSFMVRVSQATPADKVKILASESRRLGLAECPLIHAWSAGLKN